MRRRCDDHVVGGQQRQDERFGQFFQRVVRQGDSDDRLCLARRKEEGGGGDGIVRAGCRSARERVGDVQIGGGRFIQYRRHLACAVGFMRKCFGCGEGGDALVRPDDSQRVEESGVLARGVRLVFAVGPAQGDVAGLGQVKGDPLPFRLARDAAVLDAVGGERQPIIVALRRHLPAERDLGGAGQHHFHPRAVPIADGTAAHGIDAVGRDGRLSEPRRVFRVAYDERPGVQRRRHIGKQVGRFGHLARIVILQERPCAEGGRGRDGDRLRVELRGCVWGCAVGGEADGRAGNLLRDRDRERFGERSAGAWQIGRRLGLFSEGPSREVDLIDPAAVAAGGVAVILGVAPLDRVQA